jgi:hypothetical protein
MGGRDPRLTRISGTRTASPRSPWSKACRDSFGQPRLALPLASMSTETIAVISGLGSGLIVALATGLIEWVRVRERRHGQLVGAGTAFLVAGEQLIAELANQPRPSRVGDAVVSLVERFLPEMDYLGGQANQRLFHPGLPAARDRYWEAVATLLLIGDRRIIVALVNTGQALEKAVDDPEACAAGIRQAQADIARVVNPLGPRSWWRPGHRSVPKLVDAPGTGDSGDERAQKGGGATQGASAPDDPAP